MVSTRAGARTVPESVAEPELSLRKKPIRKPAAKAQSTSTRAKVETKSSRPKDPKSTKKSTEICANEDVRVEAEVPARKTRKTAARVIAGEDSKTTSESTKKDAAPPRKTRATAPKTSQTSSTAAQHPELKPSAPTRATRATRATTAKEKGQPLSPKKITQVSKTLHTKTQSLDEKADKKPVRQAAQPTMTRKVARKRAASDENADLDNGERLDVESRPIKAKRQRRSKSTTDENTDVVFEAVAHKDASSSNTRALESPGHAAMPDAVLDAEDIETLSAAGSSLDELCGPKTPMKRCSPRTSFALTSAQRNSYRRTPVRRFEVYSGPHRTPQTQRPHIRNYDSFDDSRAMTVARARDRAMVFPKLGALPEIALTYKPVTSDAHDRGQSPVESGAQLDGTDMAYEFEHTGLETGQHENVLADLPADDYEGAQASSPIAARADAAEVEMTVIAGVPSTPVTLRSTVKLASSSPLRTLLTSNDELPAVAAEENEAGEEGDGLPHAHESCHDEPVCASPCLPELDCTERLSPLPKAAIDEAPTDQDPPAVQDAVADAQVSRRKSRRSDRDLLQFADDTINFSDFINASTPLATVGSTLAPMEACADFGSPTLMSSIISPKLDSEVAGGSGDKTIATSSQQIASPEPQPRVGYGASKHDVGQVSSAVLGREECMAHENLVDYEFTFRVDPPHYALPTIASRRKSLPTIGYASPTKQITRPQTSDGACIAVHPTDTNATHSRKENLSSFATPRRKLPLVQTNTTSAVRFEFRGATPSSVKDLRTCRTEGPKPRQTGDIVQTTSMHATPMRPRVARPAECLTSTVSSTPRTPSSTPRDVGTSMTEFRKRKRSFGEHARTAMPSFRFHDLSTNSVPRRPLTARKQMSIRERAIKSSTMYGSRTPTKTPLKAPAVTPGMIPMTPHPRAPLRGVVALVEVFTNEGASASSSFTALLQRLGARTTRTWCDRLTHVVFKDGSPTTLQRLRLHNKAVADSSKGSSIHCVNSRWVSDCDAEGCRLEESDEAYAVDVDDVPRAGKRRRVSMEPSALTNVDGNIVKDRKTSLGRSALGRLSLKPASPDISSLWGTEGVANDAHNDADEPWSPSTPAYLTAPTSLVQQTAPINRIRKLELGGKSARDGNRRLTFWNGGV